MSQEPNIALHCSALQSSTSIWSSSQSPSKDAEIATSGDANSQSWFHTEHEPSPWWQVDLGDNYLINEIVIINRPSFQERLRFFTLYRSCDGVYWLPFFKRTDSVSFDTFTAEVKSECLARFIRLRLDGIGFLHFRQFHVHGSRPTASIKNLFLANDAQFIRERLAVPEGHSGHICDVGGFAVFSDEDYNLGVRGHLEGGGGQYEARERQLVQEFLRPGDRVLEAGTAIGIVSMTAASIVGAANVITFEANPFMVAASRDNFKRNRLDRIKSNHGILARRGTIDGKSETDFYIAKDFLMSRLEPGSQEDITNVVKVPIFELEAEVQKHSANVLICDIEGGEVDLLTGADLHAIRLIILETHYWSAGEIPTDSMMHYLLMQGFYLHLGVSGHHVSLLRR